MKKGSKSYIRVLSQKLLFCIAKIYNAIPINILLENRVIFF